MAGELSRKGEIRVGAGFPVPTSNFAAHTINDGE